MLWRSIAMLGLLGVVIEATGILVFIALLLIFMLQAVHLGAKIRG